MAKGIGILLIMIGHLGITAIPKAKYIQVWIYSFHIPMFFFLSGYLFSIGSSLKEFVLKKLRTVVLPYFTLGLAILLYNIYSAVKANTYSAAWFWETIRRFVVQDRFWTIWFLASILVLNIMMYPLVRFLKRTWMIAATAIAVAVIGLLYYHFGGSKLPWDIDVAFCAMPFFGGGFLIRRHKDRIGFFVRGKARSLIMFFACGASNIFFCFLNYHSSHRPCDMFSMYYGIAPLMYLSAFSGIAAVVIFCRRFIWRPICFIGGNSLVFFALHQEIAMPIAKNLMSNVHFVVAQGDPTSKILLYFVVELSLILLIMTAIVILINNTSLRKLIGKR